MFWFSNGWDYSCSHSHLKSKLQKIQILNVSVFQMVGFQIPVLWEEGNRKVFVLTLIMEDFLKKIQPDKIMRKYLMTLLSTCLTGSICVESFYIFVG